MSLTLTRRHNVDRFGYLIPTRYGNVPMVGAVATYRPGEGRFVGAVAVEEGTTNLVSSNRLKFEGWIKFDDAQVTLTQNVEFPEIGRNDATRIRTTGGTSTLKYLTSFGVPIAGQACTGSVYIKNIGSKPVRFRTQLGPSVTVNPGEWTRAIVSGVGNGVAHFQLRFEALNVDDDLDFIAWGPQAEYKPFATSFVAGARAAGDLNHDPFILNKTHGTIAAWFKLHNLNERYNVLITTSRASSPGPRLLIMREFAGVNANKLRVWDGDGETEEIITATTVLQKDVWYHFAFTWSPSGRRFYINGSLEASSARSEPIGGSYLRIGRWGGSEEVLNGLIDGLLILPYAASEEEIRSWYEADGPLPPHPDALLQWDWQAVRPATMVAL